MNERWYSISVSEAEKKLNTNISSGLDAKEAERRRRRGDGGSVFKDPSEPLLNHIVRVATDINFIIFAIVSLISAFLDDGKSAGFAFAISVIAFALSVLCYVFSKRGFEDFASCSIPRTKVIRGGRVYLVEADEVVTGDVILLEKGDITPCDCRLVSSSEMKAVEFVGKVRDKEKRELTDKDAGFICRPEDKPNVAGQKNMLVASSIIVTGSGRAIAVRTGRRSFVSLLVGEIDMIPKRKSDMKILEDLHKIIFKLGLLILVAAVPVTVVTMLTGQKSVGLMGVLLSLLALAMTSGSEMISGLTYLFPILNMKKSANRKNGAIIKYPNAMQELNYIDSVLVLGDSSISTNKKYVENIFASNNFYSAENLPEKNEQPLSCFLDLAVLGTLHYLDSGIGAAFSVDEENVLCAKAVLEAAERFGINREILESRYERVDYLPADVAEHDTTLVRDGEEYRVICTSESSSVLGICSYIRTPEGAIELDVDKRADIIRACEQLKKKAKRVLLVASRISPCQNLDRPGLIKNQLVFEGYVIFGAPYIDGIAQQIQEMREADISFYYAAGENANSVITAFNIGAVNSKKEIAYSSAFKRNGKQITDGLGSYRAYLGFSEKELEALAKAIRGEDGTLAVICTETDHISVFGAANVSVAVTGNVGSKKAIEAFEGCSELVRKNADVLVPMANRTGGGFSAFADAVITSKNCIAGLCKFLRYFAFSVSFRLILTIIPLLFGMMSLGASQIVFLGALIDIPALIAFANIKHNNSFAEKIDDIETLLSSPIKQTMKYIISGVSLGVVMLLLTAVFGNAGGIDAKDLSTLAFLGATISQVFAVIILARSDEELKKEKLAVILYCAFAVLFIVVAMFVPFLGELISVSYPGWQVCSAAVLISIIGYVIFLITDRYI